MLRQGPLDLSFSAGVDPSDEDGWTDALPYSVIFSLAALEIEPEPELGPEVEVEARDVDEAWPTFRDRAPPSLSLPALGETPGLTRAKLCGAADAPSPSATAAEDEPERWVKLPIRAVRLGRDFFFVEEFEKILAAG